MRDDDEIKIYGPRKHGNKWRVAFVSGRGESRTADYESFETEEEAAACIAGARSEASKSLTVNQGVALWIEKQRLKGHADTTIENYEHRLAMIFVLEKNGERPLRWLLPRGAELYTASKADRATDTHHNALSVARRCCAWLVKQRHLRENPFEDVEPDGKRKKGSRKDKLRVDEARLIQVACHRERGVDGALVLSYLLLGARASEIILRCVRDLDDHGRLLWIDETKTEAGTRRLIIPDELRPLLLELADGRASNDRLFLNLSGDPMTRRVAYQRVCAFTKRVIGRELGPQGFRRTQSTLATDAGATGPMVSAHLGHVTAGDMAEITKRSYADPSAVEGARIARGLVVLRGGNGFGNNSGNTNDETSKESA